MKKIFLITFLSFFISSVLYSQSKLPECKSTDKVLYHNCYGKKFYGRSGEYYEAEFKNNTPVGEIKFSSGDKYVGGFKDNGWYHGKGTYYHKSGSIFTGEFKNGKRHGAGTNNLFDGRKIIGEWKDGELLKGEMIFPNGAIYKGEFKEGLPNGSGTYTHKDGKKEIGNFKDLSLDGKGKQFLANGQILYDGEFKEGLWEGKGTLYLPEGGTYVGEFKNKLPDGKGTRTSSDGRKLSGQWKEGRFIE